MVWRKKSEPYSTQCPECGLGYVYPYDKLYHEMNHLLYLNACEWFGFKISFYSERERLKQDAYNIVFNESGSVSEKVAAVEKLFRAYFNRSVEFSKYDLKHPRFTDYCAMLLNQKFWNKRLELFPDVLKLLLKKYGRKAGISEGTTSYPPREKYQIARRKAMRLLKGYGAQFAVSYLMEVSLFED